MDNLEQLLEEDCICCDGEGIQIRNDGIKILCPECEGSGKTKPKGLNFYEGTWTIDPYQPFIQYNPYRQIGTGDPLPWDYTKITC
jgi:hypothetical protein